MTLSELLHAWQTLEDHLHAPSAATASLHHDNQQFCASVRGFLSGRTRSDIHSANPLRAP
jgi:hypothetical protein